MPFSLMSVAITVAPSRANAIAQVLPMPAAAAVTTARFPSVDLTCFSFSLLLPRHSGARRSREPGIDTPDRGYGFGARASHAPE